MEAGRRLIPGRIYSGIDCLNPIIETNSTRDRSRTSNEAWSANKITDLSKIYALAGIRERLESPTKLSETFYKQILGECSREISLDEFDSSQRNFIPYLFQSLSIQEKEELIKKYNPEFPVLLRSLGMSMEVLFPDTGNNPPITNAKQWIEEQIKLINDLWTARNSDHVEPDPLSLVDKCRAFISRFGPFPQIAAINFLAGVYGLLSPEKQKSLHDKLCSTLDQELNESQDAIVTIDKALEEACSETVFAKDIKRILENSSDFSKRLFRHRIIYDSKLKEPFKSNWDYSRLIWNSDALFDTDNNPLAASSAQDLIKTRLPGLSPDSLFSHLARMKTSSYVFNHIFNDDVCKTLEDCLLEGNLEWTRAKKIGDKLKRHQLVNLQSEPIIKSQSPNGYTGNRSGKVTGSVEYSFSRPYTDGDDVLRSMDWHLFARTGKPHTKVMTNDIKLRSQEYIIDLSWLNSLKPFENLVQFIYQNSHKNNNQSLTITCHGVPILQLSKEEINGIVNGKVIEDQYGKRTRIMDFYLSLVALASAKLGPFNMLDTPIITEPYLPRYNNSQVHILVPGGTRSQKITSAYHLFDRWSQQKGSEVLAARSIN